MGCDSIDPVNPIADGCSLGKIVVIPVEGHAADAGGRGEASGSGRGPEGGREDLRISIQETETNNQRCSHTLVTSFDIDIGLTRPAGPPLDGGVSDIKTGDVGSPPGSFL